MEKDDQNLKPQITSKEKPAENIPEKKKEKSAFVQFLGRIGYSVWLTVMIIGGILAFLASLLLL